MNSSSQDYSLLFVFKKNGMINYFAIEVALKKVRERETSVKSKFRELRSQKIIKS